MVPLVSLSMNNYHVQANDAWTRIQEQVQKNNWQEIRKILRLEARNLTPAQQIDLWLAIPGADEGRMLMECGLNANMKREYGKTALHIFVSRHTCINGVLIEPVFTDSHRKTFEALLACGADPTLDSWFLPENPPLTVLELNGNQEIQQILEHHLNPVKG
ncbi:MAG: hypothetical protein LLG04_12270 [Parachlamydia sp.]|nr:hypothetical protein [Parachlamydia sp.]